jgi:TonB family protein
MKRFAIVLICFGMVVLACVAKLPAKPLPVVTSASVPLYPVAARAMGIEGRVVLHVSTDGKGVSNVIAVRGPLMLQKTAKENVQTWQFEEHSPTSFDVVFRYKLYDCRECSDNSTVSLKLPTDVEVSIPRVVIEDPVFHQ